MSWKRLGACAPTELADARLQLHWAAQVAASPGVSLADKRDDDSQTAFEYWPERAALVGAAAGHEGWRCGLRVADAELVLFDAHGHPIDDQPLVGRTLEECRSWLVSAAAPLSSLPVGQRLRLSEHEPPSHPVNTAGARFGAESRVPAGELGRWFACGYDAISQVHGSVDGASPIRVWPHHFDLATLIQLDPDAPSESARTIGVGLSPGDAGYPQPYFYVTPWPYPPADGLVELDSRGCWHTEGWVGAILTGDHLIRVAPEDRRRVAMAFITGAIEACRAALESAED